MTTVNTKKNRIAGLDIARAVAIVGMTAEHFGPASWAPWTLGWPSLLFAFLSGMSMALMVRHGLAVGVPLSQMRRRIMIRGAILMIVGLLLASAGPSMIIVLATLGASFLLCSMLISLSGPVLLAVGTTGMFVLPQLSYWLRHNVFPSNGDQSGVVPNLGHFTSMEGAEVALRALLLDGMYPTITWIPVIIVGMGVMTVGVDGIKRIVWLCLGAGAAAASGIFTWVMVTRFDVQPIMLKFTGMSLRELADASGTNVIGAWRAAGVAYGTTSTTDDLLLDGAHSGSTPDLLLNIGISLVIIVVCLYVGELLGLWLFPLSALGSCAFTVYVGQALVSAAINHWLPDLNDESGVSLLPFALYLIIPVAFCIIWKSFFRRGPLEQAMHAASTWERR